MPEHSGQFPDDNQSRREGRSREPKWEPTVIGMACREQ